MPDLSAEAEAASRRLARIEKMIDAEIERVRQTDDLLPAKWWQFLRRQWLDGVGTARAVTERHLWRIKSAFYEDAEEVPDAH